MTDTQGDYATPTELFVDRVVDQGLSQSLTDLGLSQFIVDWLNEELNVPRLFGRLVVKTFALLTDKAGKAAGESLLKVLMGLPQYQKIERHLTDLLIHIDKDIRAKEEVRRVLAGERLAVISPELAHHLTLDLQAELKIIHDVETLSAMFSEVATKKQLAELSLYIASSLSQITYFLNPQPLLQINVFTEEADGRYRFLYGAQKSEFGGRTEELRALQGFLACETSFCWWMVLGEAGLGKSRLALELCLRSGWRAGFLPSSYSVDEYRNWVPNQPTLIIADYAAFRAKDIGEIVRLLQTQANCKRLTFPVRLILLERSRRKHYGKEAYYADVLEEAWFKTFEGVFGADQQLTHSAWYAKGRKPMLLGSLHADHTWAIICAFGKGKPRQNQRDDILRVLNKQIDRLSRPLYAAMLGDAIGAGRHYNQLGTLDVLTDILQREEERFWRPAWDEADITKEDRERDKDVLALATMAGEFDMNSAFLPTALEDMINGETFSWERYALMSAGSTGDILKPLLPDVLGEAFVLEHLNPRNSRQTTKCERLRNIAWLLNRENLSFFWSRVADDFAEHPTVKCLRASH